MPPSGPIVALLEAFRSEFTTPTWTKVVLLLWGTILARGRRTVTAALRPMGLDDDADFSKYHHVFNRAVWSPLRLACTLTRLLVRIFFRSDPRLTFVIDETLERRWGRRIRIRGHYRDPLAFQQGTLGGGPVASAGSSWRWSSPRRGAPSPGPCRC